MVSSPWEEPLRRYDDEGYAVDFTVLNGTQQDDESAQVASSTSMPNVVLEFDPHQPRDPEGKWIDVVGTLSHLKWDELSKHADKVIATYDDDVTGTKRRAVVREGNGKTYVEVQLKKGKKWSRFKDYKSSSDYENNIVNNKFMDWLPVTPHSTEDEPTPVSGVGTGKDYVAENPPGSTHYGLAKNKWQFLPPSDAPAGWSTGKNVISADEAQKLHDDVMDKNSWNDTVATAVHDYTGSSEMLSEAIRNDESHTDEGFSVRSATRQLDKAMYELPRDVTVFRQVHSSAFGVQDIADLKKLTGKTFTDKSYLSTSVTQQMRGNDTISDVHMKINVPKGAKAAYVADMSEYPEQDEMLLARRTKLKITAIDIKNGRAFITADVVLPTKK